MCNCFGYILPQITSNSNNNFYIFAPWFYKILPARYDTILLSKELVIISTIYIDILFFVNLAINLSILLCMKCILKLPMKPVRAFMGGSAGALYACLVYTVKTDALSCVAMRLLFAALIVTLSFGTGNFICILKRTLVFIALTIALGIAMLGILYFTDLGIRLGGIIKDGVFYFNIPLHYMIFCTLGAYILIFVWEKLFKKSASRSFSRVKIHHFGKAVELTALVDTGNMLSDPISGRKVLIAEAQMLSPLFNFSIENILKDSFESAYLPEGFRLIPYSSIGKKDGLLAAFVPDEVEIDSKKADNIITAVFDGALSGSGDYNALIGPDI